MTKKNTKLYLTFDSAFKDFCHPNPNINDLAIKIMISSWPEQSIAILISKLNDSDASLRRKAIKALGCFGHEVVDQIVKLFLLSDELMIKLSCLKVFIKMTKTNKSIFLNDRLIDVIEVAIKDDNPVMILTIINLLRQLGELGLPYLIDCSKDSHILRAKAAITAIGEINHPKAMRCLQSIIKDHSRDSLIVESAVDSSQLYS